MLNLWEQASVTALVLADAVRDLAARRIECEDDAEGIGMAMQEIAAEISAIGLSLIRLNSHPTINRDTTFGRRGITGSGRR